MTRSHGTRAAGSHASRAIAGTAMAIRTRPAWSATRRQIRSRCIWSAASAMGSVSYQTTATPPAGAGQRPLAVAGHYRLAAIAGAGLRSEASAS
jgi:hypothetical protein